VPLTQDILAHTEICTAIMGSCWPKSTCISRAMLGLPSPTSKLLTVAHAMGWGWDTHGRHTATPRLNGVHSEGFTTSFPNMLTRDNGLPKPVSVDPPDKLFTGALKEPLHIAVTTPYMACHTHEQARYPWQVTCQDDSHVKCW